MRLAAEFLQTFKSKTGIALSRLCTAIWNEFSLFFLNNFTPSLKISPEEKMHNGVFADMYFDLKIKIYQYNLKSSCLEWHVVNHSFKTTKYCM